MEETTEQYRNRINQLKTDIENEPYIKKMRENIAEGISKTGNRQADIEGQFQEVIDNTTGKDVIAAPELIAARNGEANLKTRLDKEKQEVNAQLEQTMTQTEFDSWVATLLDGGPSIFFDTLSALKTAYPYGADGVALVRETDPAKIYVWNGIGWEDFGDYQGLELKDESVTTEKYAPQSLTPDKTTFTRAGKNKFNGSYETGVEITDGLLYRETSDGLGNVAVVKVDKSKTYSVSRGGGGKFRVFVSNGTPSAWETVSRYILNADYQNEVIGIQLEGDNDHILIDVGNTRPDWIQIEEGVEVTDYRPYAPVYDMDDESLSARALKGILPTGTLTGSYLGFNVDMINSKVITRNSGDALCTVVVGKKKYFIKDGEWSFSHLTSHSVVVVFNIDTSEIEFYEQDSFIQSNNFDNPVIGIIGKSSGVCDFFGTYSINGSATRAYREKDAEKLKRMDYKAVLTGSNASFNVDTKKESIITLASAFINVGNQHYEMKAGNYPYSAVPGITVIVVFNMQSREIEYYTFNTLHERNVENSVVIGTIRRGGNPTINLEGIYSVDGSAIQPFTKRDKDKLKPEFIISYIPSGRYKSNSEHVLVESLQAADIYAMYDALIEAYPDYVTKEFLGNEVTGLPLYAYYLTPKKPVTQEGDLPKIIYTSAIHGMEKHTAPAGALFFREICEQWKQNEILGMFKWNVRYAVVPVVNPYGYNHNQRPNSNGIDLNRHFPNGFTVNPDPSDYYYGGEAPLVELEAQYMDTFMEKNKDAILAMDHHNYGAVSHSDTVIWYGTDYPNSKKLLNALGTQMSSYAIENYPYLPQENINMTSITSIEGGMLSKYWYSKGVNSILFETPYEMGGSEADVQRYTIDALGNTILGVLRNYEAIRDW